MFNLKLFFKVAVIIVIVLFSMIPLELIRNSIFERKDRRTEVEYEVGNAWGRPQKFIGPVLAVPYRINHMRNDTIVSTDIRRAFFFPDDLNINSELIPEIRYRSIYEVILYNLDLKVEGTFAMPDFSQWKIDNKDVIWEEACIAIGISDMRGIMKELEFRWNDSPMIFKPGNRDIDIVGSGMHVLLPDLIDSDSSEENADGAVGLIIPDSNKKFSFAFNLQVNGSREFSVVPIGKQNNINMHSEWPDPSFYGSYLPNSREIDENGFNASWALTYFGRNFKQDWKESEVSSAIVNEIQGTDLGVILMMPVDYYAKVSRSAKYGILFIALTFVIYFLVEILGSIRIHPMQYLLVGSALALFYLILLSLSEHINFLASYISASAAVILLISIYSGTITKSKKRGLVLGGFLVMLYGYLYVLLQLQDYSLLLGSVALFVILAIFMMSTRKVNWYELNLSGNKNQENKKSILDRFEIKRKDESD